MLTYSYKPLPFLSISITFTKNGIEIKSPLHKQILTWADISHAGVIKHIDSGLNQKHPDYRKLVPPFVISAMQLNDNTFRILIVQNNKLIYLTVPQGMREEVIPIFQKHVGTKFLAIPTEEFTLRKQFGKPVNWVLFMPVILLFFIISAIIMFGWFIFILI